MAISRLTIFAIVPLAASGLFAAETVSWGSTHDEIRVGITTDSASAEPAIRVVFENTGPTERILLIGRTTGVGPIYGLKFTAVTPDGQEIKLLTGGGPAGVAGFMGPLTLRLSPGSSDGIVLPIRRLFYVAGPGKDVPLETLLAEHCSLRVSLEVSQSEVDWSTRPNSSAYPGRRFWTGTIVSAEYRKSE